MVKKVKSKKYSLEKRKEVLSEYESGATVNELTLKHGINESTIRVWISKTIRKRNQPTSGEINENKAKRNQVIAKMIFNKISVGSKLKLVYLDELTRRKNKPVLESITIHNAVVFQKSDKVIFIKDAEKDHLRSSINLGELVSGHIRVELMGGNL